MSILLRSGLTEPGGTTQGLFEYDLLNTILILEGKPGHRPITLMAGLLELPPDWWQVAGLAMMTNLFISNHLILVKG